MPDARLSNKLYFVGTGNSSIKAISPMLYPLITGFIDESVIG